MINEKIRTISACGGVKDHVVNDGRPSVASRFIVETAYGQRCFKFSHFENAEGGRWRGGDEQWAVAVFYEEPPTSTEDLEKKIRDLRIELVNADLKVSSLRKKLLNIRREAKEE